MMHLVAQRVCRRMQVTYMVLVKAILFFATATSFVEQRVSDQAMSTFDVFDIIKFCQRYNLFIVC